LLYLIRQTIVSKKFSVLEVLSETIQQITNQLLSADELTKASSTTGSGTAPILGYVFDELTQTDIENMEKLFRKDYSVGERKVAEDDDIAVVLLTKKLKSVIKCLSSKRRHLLSKVDRILDEVRVFTSFIVCQCLHFRFL
jgi:hypothetical protein